MVRADVQPYGLAAAELSEVDRMVALYKERFEATAARKRKRAAKGKGKGAKSRGKQRRQGRRG